MQVKIFPYGLCIHLNIFRVKLEKEFFVAEYINFTSFRPSGGALLRYSLIRQVR